MRRWLLNAALVPRASDPCRTPGRVLVLLNLIDRDPAGVLRALSIVVTLIEEHCWHLLREHAAKVQASLTL